MEDQFQTIQSIGRDGLLNKLTSFDSFKRDEVIRSVGDDSAVIKPGKGLQLSTSDMFVEGVDFDLTYTPLNHLGYKMLSAAISDIYAMNGRPQTALINIAVPNRMSVQMMEQLYEGIYSAGMKHEVEIVGGDLTANPSHMIVSISVQGTVEEEKICYRKGAKEGHALCVTGDLGGALAGLRILMREKNYWNEHEDENIQPDLADYQYVVKRQLVPEARKDLIDSLDTNGLVPSSMIDITKGLVNEVSALCDASATGAYLYQAALPIAIETRQVADEMEEDVDRYALFGGEDLELLFTLPEKEVEEFATQFNDFVVVGRMVPLEEGMKMQTAEGDVLSFDDLS
ncbi:thiamine-phosphate kinase [Balneola sp. MJW-20]|uniref:thiamine-phosphate kinase n=1 Tax=Gracilimonas aurantiaca TaxID=3234185 RepID=UPI003465F3E7